jgi:putative ABC transport system permease protein
LGNLDYVFERAGGDLPNYVWLDFDQGFTASQLVKPDTETGALNSPQYRISKTEQSPERQGLFGLLSVGFVAAAALTVLGFLLYVLFSFRQRYIEMGVLRALGLSTQQLVWFLIAELAFVIFTGGIIGTALGALVSAFFIPHLQIGLGESANVPPFIVEIAWGAVFPVYVLFGWLFVLALGVLVFSLRRMRIFQAIKLGETV